MTWYTAWPTAEDLEGALAVADHERRQAEGTPAPGIPMAEVRKRLGLEHK